jgi:ABC-type uncharacterized transport system ATPase subunit
MEHVEELCENLCILHRIKTAERFIENQQFRLMQDGRNELDFLLVSFRQLFLDPVNVELLKEAVISLKNSGVSIVFSSHRMEHVDRESAVQAYAGRPK